MSTFDRIASMVEAERDRQEAKWGEQNHHPTLWLTILMEEAGEAARCVLEGDPLGLHMELVQVAAVAVAAIECLERNVGRPMPDLAALQREVALLRGQVEP